MPLAPLKDPWQSVPLANNGAQVIKKSLISRTIFVHFLFFFQVQGTVRRGPGRRGASPALWGAQFRKFWWSLTCIEINLIGFNSDWRGRAGDWGERSDQGRMRKGLSSSLWLAQGLGPGIIRKGNHGIYGQFETYSHFLHYRSFWFAKTAAKMRVYCTPWRFWKRPHLKVPYHIKHIQFGQCFWCLYILLLSQPTRFPSVGCTLSILPIVPGTVSLSYTW